jgi:hypothetical protein
VHILSGDLSIQTGEIVEVNERRKRECWCNATGGKVAAARHWLYQPAQAGVSEIAILMLTEADSEM